MALANYGDLKAAVADYLARSDLTSQIVDAVTLTESRIHYGSEHPKFPSRPLRIRAMEHRENILAYATKSGTSPSGTDTITLTVAGISSYTKGLTVSFTAQGTNTTTVTLDINSIGAVAVNKGDGTEGLEAGDIVSGEAVRVYYDGTRFRLVEAGMVPLPASFLGFRRLYIDGNPRGPLDYVTPEQFDDLWASETVAKPTVYTIEGSYMRFAPVMDSDYIVKSIYYKKFTAFSADSDTNWLLTNAPGVYLYGALFETFRLIRDEAQAEVMFAEFASQLNGMHLANQKDRFSGSVLTMRSDVGNP